MALRICLLGILSKESSLISIPCPFLTSHLAGPKSTAKMIRNESGSIRFTFTADSVPPQ